MVETPLVSIVVPTFARPVQLRACLDAIARLETGRHEYEVIVVDDGSPDPVDDVIAAYADRLQIRLLRQTHGGPAAARNAGVAVAKGRYLAFTDDDCAPARDWLSAFLQEFARDDRRLLGGRVENGLTANPYSTASEHISRFVYEYSRANVAAETFFTTNNLAVSTELFRVLGGFDASIPSATAEDKEFCDRWRASGLALVHVADAVVYHANPLTLRRFLRQHFNYGRGILSFRLERRTRGRRVIVPEPLTFYTGLMLSPLRTPSTAHAWRLVPLLVAAQLATVAGALWQGFTAVRSDRAAIQ